MSRTYKAIGINLKGMPLGESDRLLTILTQEYGLVRVVAPGARKPGSKLGGRTDLFMVNQLVLTKGRSLDKISQADTLASYTGLSKNLAKLTASQYLAELVLYQALSDQPQEDLFLLLAEHLGWLEQAMPQAVLPCLTHAIFHLLSWAGIAPQVQRCCITQAPLMPDFRDPDWRIGFSSAAGGTVSLSAIAGVTQTVAGSSRFRVSEAAAASGVAPDGRSPTPTGIWLSAVELNLLQQLAQPTPPPASCSPPGIPVWLAVEQVLRQYIQYQLDRPIRSGALIDTCFLPLTTHSPG